MPMDRSVARNISEALEEAGISVSPANVERAYNLGILGAVFDPSARYNNVDAVREALSLSKEESASAEA